MNLGLDDGRAGSKGKAVASSASSKDPADAAGAGGGASDAFKEGLQALKDRRK